MQGKIAARSEYSPLQLFSGNHEQVTAAVMHLLQSPQNNLSVFRSGQPVPVQLQKEDGCMLANDELQSVLHTLLPDAPAAALVPEFASLVAVRPPVVDRSDGAPGHTHTLPCCS